ncbi:MAG: hypothetical protein U9N02_02260 [Campylobacterota bacterium]|nr:hypothetical protein [Campylobacterota bacterium]
MQNVVRKNFVFDAEVASYLEELAKDTKKSMTALVQDIIRDRYKIVKAKKRLKALKQMDASFDGTIGDKSIQMIKADKDV